MNRKFALLVYLTLAALNFPSVEAAPPEMFNPNIVWRDQDINAPYEQYRDYRFSKGSDGRTSFTITWLSAKDGTLVAGPFLGGQTNPSEPTYFDDLGNGRIRIGSSEFQVTLDASGQLNFSRDGKATHRLSSHPPISRDVEIEVAESATPHDDYVTWASTVCRARLNASAGHTLPVTVVLTNDAATEGGDVLFAPHQNPWPSFTTATQEELTLTLPASGEWVSFVIAGKFGRASLRDKDAIIDVHEGTSDGRILGGHALMVRVRKAAETLTPEERYRFLRAMAMMKRRGGGSADYEFYHRLHARDDVQSSNHGSSLFLPWHRAFLLRFERELQANDPSVTLPYWNWQQPPGEVFSPEFLGTGGARVTFDGVTSALSPIFADGLNPIHHFQFHRSEKPNNAVEIPERTRHELALNDALNSRDYNRLSYLLEYFPHNELHTWVGGDMQAMSSPKDPVFFLHHCSVDRIWAQWQHDLNFFGTASPDYIPFAYKARPDGTIEPEATPEANPELILDGPMPASEIAGVWPKQAIQARPLDVIDYLNTHVADTNLGFCYDNIRFGARSPGVQNPAPAPVAQPLSPVVEPLPTTAQRDGNRHILAVVPAAVATQEEPFNGTPAFDVASFSDFTNAALTEDERLQAGRRLIVVTGEPEIDQTRGIAADRTQPVRVRVMAIELVPSAAILQTLLEILEDQQADLEVKKAAAKALEIALFAVHSDMRVRIFNALRQYINDPCPELRAVALSILVPRHDAAAVEFVKDSLSGKVADSHLSTVTAIQLLAADDPRKHLNVIRPFLNPGVAGLNAKRLNVLKFQQDGFHDGDKSEPKTFLGTLTQISDREWTATSDDGTSAKFALEQQTGSVVVLVVESSPGVVADRLQIDLAKKTMKSLVHPGLKFTVLSLSEQRGTPNGGGAKDVDPRNNDNIPEVLTAAIEAIGFDPGSRDLIVRHLQDRGQPLNVRKAALRAVEEDRGQAINLAKRVISDSTETPQLRIAAINTLGGICSSRVHEINLRSEQVAAGRTPLVIEEDVPAISADGRASVYDLLKQTACSVDSPDVAAEAFRVAHWLRIYDPAVRQRPQPPAAQPPVQLPNQPPPGGGDFNPIPPVNPGPPVTPENFNPGPPFNPGNFNPDGLGNFNQGEYPRNSIYRLFGNGRNQPPQSGGTLRGDCNRPLFGTIP